jgi:hypothetical protein
VLEAMVDCGTRESNGNQLRERERERRSARTVAEDAFEIVEDDHREGTAVRSLEGLANARLALALAAPEHPLAVRTEAAHEGVAGIDRHLRREGRFPAALGPVQEQGEDRRDVADLRHCERRRRLQLLAPEAEWDNPVRNVERQVVVLRPERRRRFGDGAHEVALLDADAGRVERFRKVRDVHGSAHRELARAADEALDLSARVVLALARELRRVDIRGEPVALLHPAGVDIQDLNSP